MYKKLIIIGIVVLMLFSLTACGNDTYSFDNLEEIQEALSADFYYFELDIEVFGEAKEFSATKSKQSDFDGKQFYRYSIWYDVKNLDNGQDYRFNVIGTHYRKPLKISAPTIGSITVDEVHINLLHDDRSESGFPLSQKGDFVGEFTLDEYFYCYILSGTQYPLDESELEYFKFICELAIFSRYKLL